MTEIHSIIFLVPLLNPFALFIEHVIDLSDMLLHRSRHPLLLLGVHFLNLLPVFISDPNWNLQLGWRILHHFVDVRVDDVNLAFDGVNRIDQDCLSRIVLTDGRCWTVYMSVPSSSCNEAYVWRKQWKVICFSIPHSFNQLCITPYVIVRLNPWKIYVLLVFGWIRAYASSPIGTWVWHFVFTQMKSR